MQILPSTDYLPIDKLVACFNNTTATYKFYWLLSILEQVEKGKTLLSKKELFAGMVSHAWYTVHYFHVSFGKFDLLGELIYKLKEIEDLEISASRESIRDQLTLSENPNTKKYLLHFDRNVPHWFLSPWFPGKSKKEIYAFSNNSSYQSPYGLDDEFITMNLLWSNYFIKYAALIRSFCFWKLSLYLQGKNPNVPDIPNKLIKPAQRNSLARQRGFWNLVLDEMGEIICIYTQKSLKKGDYAIDHFIPYNFVSHDLIWNLIPADTIFNIKKSDKLPRLEAFFEPFYAIQKNAVEIMTDKHPRHPLLDDYISIFSSVDDLLAPKKFYEQLQPIISIAANNGFEYLSL